MPVINNEPEEQLDDNDREFDITEEEKALLDNAGAATPDDENLAESSLDNVDEDGEPLNVDSGDLSGNDLDVPGAMLDDDDEATGNEDEENNTYSEGDTD